MKGPFLIIDANSIFHRAYHALPRLTTKKGELVNAVYGFILVLMRALKEFKPEYIAAAFDVAGPTFRDEEFEAYKATRQKAPDELYAQIPRIKEVLVAFHIPIYEKQGYEADDLIGTVTYILTKKHPDIPVFIVSGDLDTLQLVTKQVQVYTMKKSVQDTVVYNEKAVKDRFGLRPGQLADYKGLRGDPSDNIPGVPGIGEKTASTLLQNYSTLEKLYSALEAGKTKDIKGKMHEALMSNKEQAFFSRMLATIRTDVPIKFSLHDAKWGGFKIAEVEAIFRELNFTALLQRLNELKGFETTDQLNTSTATGSDRREQELLQEVETARDVGILSDVLYRTEKELVPVILDMEAKGIAVDKPMLHKLKQEIEAELIQLEAPIYKGAGRTFNINSPQQLSEVLFDELHIATKGLRKTPGKKISTAASELEKLKGTHPVIDLILQQRELQKLLSTYVAPLPESVDAEGRIHTTFKPFGTATGRMSSANPNLQNIPIRGEWAAKIRNAFVAEKGNAFLTCDYSQMELRIVAHLAQDKNMIRVFERGEDIHTNTAALVFGLKPEDVTAQMRYRAKALNFGIIYGIGPRAFAESAQISFEEAQDFIQRYLDVFEGVAFYMQATKEKAYQLGYVETLFGRKRFLPDLASPNPMLRAMAERAAINMPVQGTAADIVKMAMVRAHNELKEIDLLLQIHDELLWEGGRDTIEKIAPKAQQLLETTVPLSVPLRVDYSISTSWGTLKTHA